MSGHEFVEVIMDSSGSYLVNLMDLPEDDQIVPDLLTPNTSSILANTFGQSGAPAVNNANLSATVDIGFPSQVDMAYTLSFTVNTQRLSLVAVHTCKITEYVFAKYFKELGALFKKWKTKSDLLGHHETFKNSS